MKNSIDVLLKITNITCHVVKNTNAKNKRQVLVLPTRIRVDFWLLYCKRKYEKGKQAGLADAHKALYHYDKNIEKYKDTNKKNEK